MKKIIKYIKEHLKLVDWATYIGLFIVLYISSMVNGNYFNYQFIIVWILILPLIIICGKFQYKIKNRIDDRNDRRTSDKNNRESTLD